MMFVAVVVVLPIALEVRGMDAAPTMRRAKS